MRETVTLVLLAMAVAGAIFFWGLGIRRGRKLYLLFGPAIIVILCAATGGSGLFVSAGEILGVFGIATLPLSFLAPNEGPMPRRTVRLIGAGAIVAGMYFIMVL